MRSLLATCAISAVLIAPGAVAQDEGTPPRGDPRELGPDAPQGILGTELPENRERNQARLLQNYLSMDLNSDLLLAKSEWHVWSGWRGSPPPDFASIDVNGSAYIVYSEYEDAALAGGDGRLDDAMHGAVFPEEDVAE